MDFGFKSVALPHMTSMVEVLSSNEDYEYIVS